MTEARAGSGFRADCVVVEVHSAQPSRAALSAAVEVAQAFRAALRSVYVEDTELVSLACLPCAREISLSGRAAGPLSLAGLEQQMRLASSAVRRDLERLARAASVPFAADTVRDEPGRALAACCSSGSLLALAEPVGTAGIARLRALLDEVADLAGVLLVGPRSRRTPGPLTLVVEDLHRLPALLEAARPLQSAADPRLALLVVGDGAAEASAMEARARRLLGHASHIRFARVAAGHGVADAVAEAVRGLEPGFLLASLGGLLSPGRSELLRLTQVLACPVLLLR